MKPLALLVALSAAASAQAAARLPTLELSAIVNQGAFGRGESPLTEKEKGWARAVFGDALDLEAVRVVYAKTPTGDPMTWGDTIRMPPGHDLSQGTIVHELAHVWQYQTRGSGYISDSLLAQACAYARGGSRARAYDYVPAEGKSLLAYSAEQQAQILEDYAADAGKRADARYRALVETARSVKAVKGARVILMERDGGLAPRGRALPPGPAGEPSFGNEAARVPQLQLRF